MQKFKAILLKPYKGYETGTIVEVMAGGEDFEDRWLVLRPVDLAGSFLVRLVDADRAISAKEAAHIFSFRRGPGWTVWPRRVYVYIRKGKLAPAGHLSKDIGAARENAWFVSLEATWKMPLSNKWQPRPKKEKADETEEAS